MTQLLLIEGIPGSGKSTLAEKTARRYRSRGRAVELYPEGPGHPVDLGWNAGFSLQQYDDFLRAHSGLRGEIERTATIDGGTAIVPVSQAITGDEKAFRHWLAFECYTGPKRISQAECQRLLCGRWAKFGEAKRNEKTLSIFDAAFFQSQMLRLLLWGDQKEETITSQLQQIAQTVSCLSPALLYLTQPEGGETLLRAARERTHHRTGVSFYGNWLDSVIADGEPSPFWQSRHLSGIEGVLTYFETRKQMELAILPQLPLTGKIIETVQGGWDGAWARIEGVLEELDAL